MKINNLFSIFVGLVILAFAQQGSAQEYDGKALFRTNCAACHTIDQNLVGPALQGVSEKRDSAWLYAFIKNSQAMIQDGDPLAVELFNKFNKVPMPPQNLTNEEITSILQYIDGESEEAMIAAQEAAANPIKRPEEFYGANYRQFTFDDYIFWIPATITILILIAALVFMTRTHDSLNEARGIKVIPQEEL